MKFFQTQLLESIYLCYSKTLSINVATASERSLSSCSTLGALRSKELRFFTKPNAFIRQRILFRCL